MDELMAAIMEKIIKDAQKQGLNTNPISKESMIKNFAKESAKTTKILFDAYVDEGFTVDQAMKFVTSVISKQ